MQVNILSLWLLSLLGGSISEKAGVQAFQANQLDRASVILSLLENRKRRRREKLSRWREERLRIRYLAGRVALMRKRPKQAVRYLKRASRRAGLYRDYVLYYLAQAYIESGQPKRAIETYKIILKEYGGGGFRRQVRRKMMRAYRDAKDWTSYHAHLKSLLWYPNPYGGKQHLLWELAWSAFKMKDYPKSAKWARKFVRTYPLSDKTKLLWGLLKNLASNQNIAMQQSSKRDKLFKLSRISRFKPLQALHQLKGWLSKEQRNQSSKKLTLISQIRYLTAKTLIRLKRYKGAIPFWKKLLRSSGSGSYRGRLIYRLGQAYANAGQHAKTLKLFHAYAEAEPETKTAKKAAYQAAWMAFRLHRYAKARELLKEYRIVYPSRRKKRNIIEWLEAWTFFREGRYDSAIQAFKEWGAKQYRGASKRQVSYWTARSYERMRAWPKAQKIYKTLATQSPFKYYGILAQHRLYLMESEIPAFGERKVCQIKEFSSQKIKKFRFQPHLRKKKRNYPWQKKHHFALNVRLLKAANPKPKARLVGAQISPKSKLHFPGIPRSCWRSTNKSCRHLKRATVFSRLGLSKDAARELFKGRRRLKQSASTRLHAVHWLRRQGAHHEALRLSFTIPPNKAVPAYSSQKSFLRLRYPRPHANQLQSKCQLSETPSAFAWAIMREESHFRTQSLSWAGAIGLMQIMPQTGYKIAQRIGLKSFKIHSLFKPKVNIQMGCWYLGQLLHKFGGNVMLAAAAYNAGPHRVTSWLQTHYALDADEFVEEITFNETRKYVKRVFRSYVLYNFLYSKQLPPPPNAVAVTIQKNINF